MNAQPAPQAPPPLVYVVDDDDAVRDSLQLLLEAEGYAVSAYGRGDAFLADCDPARAGALVLDLNMPGLSGFEVMSELAARRVRLPTVVVSGWLPADAGARRQVIAAGARALIEKPFDTRRLVTAVGAAMGEGRPPKSAGCRR